jgi:FAD/FMN-containing dehydrogenase
VEVVDEDDGLWHAQRAGQRARQADTAVVRVAAQPSRLAELLEAVRSCAARAVGRAALGLSYVAVEPEAVERLLSSLPPGSTWTLLDAPEALRTRIDPWGQRPGEPALELMRRVKARFDPAGICNPGLFVGGI